MEEHGSLDCTALHCIALHPQLYEYVEITKKKKKEILYGVHVGYHGHPVDTRFDNQEQEARLKHYCPESKYLVRPAAYWVAPFPGGRIA